MDSTNSHGYKPLTKDALLKKLPEQYVTSGGQLVNIRSGIEMFIGGTAAAKVGGPTSPLRTIAPSTSASAQLRDDPNSGDVTSVQVKLPSGQKVMLHMFFSNTIQDEYEIYNQDKNVLKMEKISENENENEELNIDDI